MEDILAKSVPHSLSAERAVLGSMIMDNEAAIICAEILTKEDFYQKLNGVIFEKIIELTQSKKAVDEITLGSALSEVNLGVDIEELIKELILEVPTSVNAKDYANVVKEKSILRNIIHVGQELERRCHEEGRKVDEILAESESQIFALNQRHGDSELVSMRKTVMEEITRIEAASKTKGAITGVPSGFFDLDRCTQGFQNSDLIIVAARPAMGKTAFVLNIADYVSIYEKKKVAFFSLEMPRGQLVRRMMALRGNIEAGKLRSGELSEMDWGKLIEASGSIGNANMVIDDTGNIPLNELKRKCRKIAAEGDLAIVIIDYLQLITVEGKSESRQNEISTISRNLKGLAKELNVPVIALSQLSRKIEERPDKRPIMSDLRESGAIEQDADIVMFIYRDDYYNHDTEERNVSEVIIGKHRNGGLGTVKLAWIPEYTKFANKDFRNDDFSS